MNINLDIIDQRVTQLASDLEGSLDGDVDKRKSAAFVLLVAMVFLDLDRDRALEELTEGSGDAGMDLLHVDDVIDGEFLVTIVQGKYKRRLGDGESNFPVTGLQRVITTVAALFDPDTRITLHHKLQTRVEEIRSLVRDGMIPNVRVILCNNGTRWTEEGDNLIAQAAFGRQVWFEHKNHDAVVEALRRQGAVSDTIQMTGRILVEDFQFKRVLVGRMLASEVAALFERHGDNLLERNIRRFLGFSNNRVNSDIKATLLDPGRRPSFYFFNNGITLVCKKFAHNALQSADTPVKVTDFQIINGGQTCRCILEAVRERPGDEFGTASVLVRLYELDGESEDLLASITYATNSQNPVNLADLRANDEKQVALEESLKLLGYSYRRKRDDSVSDPKSIPVGVAAEAIMSVWRRRPHVSKFYRERLFGTHYDLIFGSGLNAAQLVVAVLVFRWADAYRKRAPEQDQHFIPYAGHFLAMELGAQLLDAAGVRIEEISHRTFEELLALWNSRREELTRRALARIRAGLESLGVDPERSSLQRLSATFRRGDLVEELSSHSIDGRVEELLRRA